jgi:WS/DGAT/MGAT family acyltransferase
MIKKLTLLDRAFGISESDDNPKHVAGFQILELPDGADASYVDELATELKKFRKGVAPFNCVVSTFLGIPIRLKPQMKLDMDYHIQVHEINDISDHDEVFEFVARLHEQRLDIKKPLWQGHLIKSLTGNEFIFYTKVHHMYGDGYTLLKTLQSAYSEEPQVEAFKPIWTIPHTRKKRPKGKQAVMIFTAIWAFLLTIKDFIWVCFRVLMKLIRVNKDYMPVPFTGTKTILTGQVKKGRVISVTDLNYERLYGLSKRLRASINEILLCIFDIATHRFLADYGQTFDKPLYTNIPINLRKPGDNTSGNKLAILPVAMAHGTKDPYIRLRQIIENHRVVIRAARNSQPGAFSFYTLFIQTVAMIYEFLRMSNIVHPIANILVSNMPGPRNPMYFRRCKVKAIYPLSTITPGGGINFTMLSYDEVFNIGIVCCDNDIKSLEPLVQYLHEALDMLEASIEDPTVSTDGIGEKITTEDVSEVVEPERYASESDDKAH